MLSRNSSTDGLSSRRLCVLIGNVLAVVVVFATVACRGKSSSADTAFRDVVVRKCTACGKTEEMKRQDALAKGFVDIEGIRLSDAGRTCPDCKKPTMEMMEKCERDGTVFAPGAMDKGEWKPAVCPKCGWKPPAR